MKTNQIQIKWICESYRIQSGKVDLTDKVVIKEKLIHLNCIHKHVWRIYDY